MSLSSSSKYYNVHDILAGEILVPCTLMTRVNGCGRALDQSSDGADLPAGHNLEVPLWLVTDAAQRKMVSVKWVSPWQDPQWCFVTWTGITFLRWDTVHCFTPIASAA